MGTGWLLDILAWGTACIGAAVALWALFADRARGRRRCPGCWYDMAGLKPPCVCPECGRVAEAERQLGRTRRRWGLARLGVSLLLGAWSGGSWQGMREDGWAAAFPDWVLEPALPLFRAEGARLETERRDAQLDLLNPARTFSRWERLLLADRASQLILVPPLLRSADICAGASEAEFCIAGPAFAKAALEGGSEETRFVAGRYLFTRMPESGIARRTCAALAARADRVRECRAIIDLAQLVDPGASNELMMILLGSPDPSVVRRAALELGSGGGATSAKFAALRAALSRATDEDTRGDIESAIQTLESMQRLDSR